MARKPKEFKEDEVAKRTWSVPGHLYNKFVAIAKRRGLDATAQLIVLMEEFVRQQEEANRGNEMPADMLV